MNYIITPLKADDKEAVINLQAALVFLLSKQSLVLTADELSTLQKQWQQEQQEASYGEATTKLVAVFQKQNNVDDKLGTVGEPTAAKINEVLKGLGAFEEVVRSDVEKKLEFFKFNLGTNSLQKEPFNKIYTEKRVIGRRFPKNLNS